ncbi:MAG: aldo/keto reductase [Conexivisphaerales archaeon]
MEYRQFARTGEKVSVIGMGTYYDPLWIATAAILRYRRHKDRSIKAIQTGLEAGINFIDTAEIYHTEEMVGEAIKNAKRDELFIATKVSYPYHYSYEGILKACEGSLRRLGTSYIDLYQFHMPFRLSRIRDMMRAMEKLIDSGKIRYIGVSNFSLEQMKLAMEAASKHEIVSNQVNYSLANRQIEGSLLPFCERERIAIVAYYPLGHGKLARESNLLKTFKEMYPEKTYAQIALNWLISRSDVVFPIPRASNPAHVSEDCGAAGWRMNVGSYPMER